jgi:hypothetical protein
VPENDARIIEAIALLSDKRSPKRRSGAKRLRKLKEISAGPTLLAALQREVKDPRTWETQYQMIMALAECNYSPALAYLEALAQHRFEATTVYIALGDAIVRLGRKYENDPQPVLTLMQTGNDMLIDGAFRAVAMLQLKPNADAVKQMVAYVAARSPSDGLKFWVAVAAAGWSGPVVENFLQDCVQGVRDDVKKAAVASLQKKYLKWEPL